MGWYKTGTISVSGTVVTGASTNWTDNKQGIGPGQALLIPAAGTVKMYEILRVDSATKLTLTSDAGTVAAGQVYAIMSFYTDSIPDFARRLSAQLSYYQSQMDGWQQIMTGTGSITLTAPDGSSVTVSSFKKLTDDMATKLDKSQNLNDLANKTTARSNLGLGSSAVRDAYSATGKLFSEGDYGLGGNTISGGNVNGNMIANESCGFYAGSINTPTATSYSGIKVKINDNVGFSMAVRQNRAFIQSTESGASMGWREVTMAAVSDITVKTDIVYGDGYSSWDNVGAMQPVTFLYKDDVNKSPRRGFIAQDLEKIDSQYIKKMNGGVDEEGKLREILTLDTNPLLMDALIVVKMLIEKDLERNREMELIKNELENLKIKASY